MEYHPVSEGVEVIQMNISYFFSYDHFTSPTRYVFVYLVYEPFAASSFALFHDPYDDPVCSLR